MDSESQIAVGLQQKGLSLLFPEDSVEALQLLKIHGLSLDLAIVHREGHDPSNHGMGLDFIEKVKADPEFRDLPIILTTESWGDSECAQHQNGPHGVNAYLKPPFSVEVFQSTIETILGQSLTSPVQSPSKTPSAPPPAPPGKSPKSAAPDPVEITAGLVLEDASQVFLINEDPSGIKEREGTFVLEMPDLPPEPPVEEPHLDLNASVPPSQEVPSLVEAVPKGGIDLSLAPSELPAPTQAIEAIEAFHSGLTSADISKSDLEIPVPLQEAPPASHDEFRYEARNEPPPEPYRDEPTLVPDAPAMPRSVQSRRPTPPVKSQPKEAQATRPFQLPPSQFDAPGGEAARADNETLRSYLLLREQDVAVLNAQVRALREQNRTLELGFSEEQAKSAELSHIAREQAKKLEDFSKRGSSTIAQLQTEIDDLKVEIRSKNEKIRGLERQMSDLHEQGDHLKERVRVDIRKIRVREKELENRIEIMKKDAEAVLNSREMKIIELKKKLDLVEFNFDLLQDQFSKEKELSSQLRERLGRAAQVVKVAGGLLEAKSSSAGSETVLEGDGDNESRKDESLHQRAS